EASNVCKRMVDLCQFHDPDPRTPIEESWKEMQCLIDQGLVRYEGLSNHPTNLIERTLRVGPVPSTQNQYNPLQRRTEREILPFCLEHEIGVLGDRKSTRLNSSHGSTSYAVFCLKTKTATTQPRLHHP